MLLSLVAIGFVGLLLGLLGGGGSVLILPLLVYLVGIDPVMATCYSLVNCGKRGVVWSSEIPAAGLGRLAFCCDIWHSFSGWRFSDSLRADARHP